MSEFVVATTMVLLPALERESMILSSCNVQIQDAVLRSAVERMDVDQYEIEVWGGSLGVLNGKAGQSWVGLAGVVTPRLG